MQNHHLSLNMSLSSVTHLRSFPNLIILRRCHHRRHRIHAPATNRPSLSLSPSAIPYWSAKLVQIGRPYVYTHRSKLVGHTSVKCGAAAGIGDLLHDAGATAILLAGAYSLVLGFDTLTQRNVIQQVSLSNLDRLLGCGWF